MFDQMKCFIALVEARSFTKAAENLNMSQSSLSQKIKNLAVSNNLTLLTHHGRSFELTRAGEYFYQHSKNIVDNVEKLVAETKLIEKEDNGIYTLRIGYLRKFGTQDYLRTVNEFSKKYPDVEIQIASGSYQQLFEMIQNDQIDINFSDARQDLSDRYQNQYLTTADYMVAVSTKSFLNYSDKIDTTDLVDLPCILVAGVDDFESERTYYRGILGIASPFKVVKSFGEAQMLAAAGQGYYICNRRTAKQIDPTINKTLQLFNHQNRLVEKYYTYWKKNNSGYYIESFSQMLKDMF